MWGVTMRLLQTCAGGLAMNSITAEFRKHIDNGQLFLGDMENLNVDNFVKLPHPKKPGEYVGAINHLADDAGARLVVYPHNHTEAIALSKHYYSDKRGCKFDVMLSPPASILNTHNKLRLYNSLKDANLPALQHSETSKEFIFAPTFRDCKNMIFKPADGCGGAGIIQSAKIEENYVCCEVLHGQEYTVDALAFRGDLIDHCTRLREKSHGGICVRATIEGSKAITNVIKKLIAYFGLHGPLAIQGFMTHEGFFITDVNHRFGGGVGMSILAGWKGIENYILISKGKRPITDYKVKSITVRRWYKEEVVSENSISDRIEGRVGRGDLARVESSVSARA